MDRTKLVAIIASLTVATATGVAIFAGTTNDPTITFDARLGEASAYDGAPLHTELGGELVPAGAVNQTGVTLPPGATVSGVFMTGSAQGAFDIDAVQLVHVVDLDTGAITGEWFQVTAHSHAASAMRFTAEIGYTAPAPGDGGAP